MTSPSFLRRTRRLLTLIGVILILLLALVLSAGRWLVGELPRYHPQLEQILSEAIGRPVRIEQLQGRWQYLVPIIEARGLRIRNDEGRLLLQVQRLRLELDLPRSLLHRTPVFQRLELERPELELHQRRSGGWGVAADWGLVPVKLTDDNLFRALDRLWLQREIHLSNALITPVLADGHRLPTRVVTVGLQNHGSNRDLSARLELAPGRAVELKAHTHGFPGEPRFSADFYLNTPTLDLELLQPLLPDSWAGPDQLRGAAELWGRWRGGLLRHLDGSLRVARLDWPTHLGEQVLEDFSTELQLRVAGTDAWRLQLNRLGGRLGDRPLPLGALRLAAADGELSLSSDRLELAALAPMLGALPQLPAALGTELALLDPEGSLKHPQLTLPLAEEPRFEGFRLRADLEDVGVAAWKGAPVMRGIDGLLQADAAGGRVDLQSRGLTLDFPRLFAQGWRFDRAEGRVHWALEKASVRVRSELLTVAAEGVQGQGRFALEAPLTAGEPGSLALMIGLDESDAALAPNFVPEKVVPPALFHWLQTAIGKGRVEQGGFLYQGPLIPGERRPSVQMFFEVAGVTLDYQPDWPALREASGTVMVKGSALRVAIDEARVYEQTRVEGAQVYLPPHSSVLGVQARLTGPAADGRRVLLEAPTGEHLGDAFAQWQLDGQARTTLNLGINLSDVGESAIAVTTTLEDASYRAPDLGLAFEQVNGTLHYDHGKGLSSEGLGGRFFGQPVAVGVQSEEREDGRHTRVNLRGRMAMGDLNAWLKQPLLAHLQGETAYRATLDICTGEPGCSLLSVRSDLEGVGVTLPPPYAKAPAERTPLHLRTSLGSQPQWLRIRYGDRLHALLALGPEGLAGGELVLGADQGDPTVRPEGLWIRGALSAIEVAPWRAFVQELLPPGEEGEDGGVRPSLLREVALQTDRVQLGERRFEAVRARLAAVENGWELALDSPAVKGVITLPRDGQPYEGVFERLHLSKVSTGADTESAAVAKAVDPLAGFDPATLPALQLQVQDLRYGNAPYGRWALSVDPIPEGVRIRGIEGRARALDVQADLWWTRDAAGHHSRTKLRLAAQDLADVIRAWDKPPFMESERARLSGELSWQGSPLHFEPTTLRGELELSARNGRFLDAGDAGSLKPFGLLNLGTLKRRLRLDFSDLYQKGLAFDRIQGRYLIDLGVAVNREPLVITGPSADIVLEGAANLVEKTLDQRMRVTLPLSGSLPLTAALLGGPQLAGAVFLIEKVIGEQLRKFTSIHYLVSGPWEDPVVEPVKRPPPEGGQPLGLNDN